MMVKNSGDPIWCSHRNQKKKDVMNIVDLENSTSACIIYDYTNIETKVKLWIIF